MIIAEPKELIAAFVSVRQGLKPDAPWGSFTALGLIRGERLVAGVIYNNFEGANACMHVGAEDGAMWLTPEFLHAAFDYPFNQLGKRRVTALTRKKNKRVRHFVENLGFKYEGTLPHYYQDDDMCVYGLLRANCRFLDMRKAA